MTSVLKDVCEREIDLGSAAKARFFSLPALEQAGFQQAYKGWTRRPKKT